MSRPLAHHDNDFLAIGDVVVDAFIKLKEASVSCDEKGENCELKMKFADKIPYSESHIIPAVGNSANAAVAAARLGLKTAFYTNIGQDVHGKSCITALEAEGISTKFIKSHAGHKTNYHYVLWFEDDRTILVKHEDYEYKLPDLGHPKWIYLTSLGEGAVSLYPELQAFLSSHPETKLAFQPGTFQMRLGVDKLSYFYERSEVFFCNKEEAQRILGIAEDDISSLLTLVKKLGPKIVVITDGKNGAYLLDESGSKWFMPPYPDPKPPLERTGAGDSFSSTFVAALALGLTSKEALRWGPVNSMSVVQYVGAREGLLSKAKLESYLRLASIDYTPKRIG